MKKNSLKENMRRFGTKNLNKLTEQRKLKSGIKIDPVVKAFDDVLKQQGFTFRMFDHPWDVYTHHNSEGLMTLMCLVDWETDGARKRVSPSESVAVVKIIPQTDLSQREEEPTRRNYIDSEIKTGYIPRNNQVFGNEHQATEFTIPAEASLYDKKTKLKSELRRMVTKFGNKGA